MGDVGGADAVVASYERYAIPAPGGIVWGRRAREHPARSPEQIADDVLGWAVANTVR